jgi:hypothetical protein
MALRRLLKTVVIERYAVGGQAGGSPKIENYLGFPKGISGAELACRFGAEILVARAGVRGEIVAGKGVGYLEDGTKIIARASVCATGVDYRKLGLPNEDRLLSLAGAAMGSGSGRALRQQRLYRHRSRSAEERQAPRELGPGSLSHIPGCKYPRQARFHIAIKALRLSGRRRG